MQALEITLYSSSKEILLIYYFSLPDEGGENRIYQFPSFSLYFWKFWLRQGGLPFYGSQKGDEGADTDLMFQFCLPYLKILCLELTAQELCFHSFAKFIDLLVVFPCISYKNLMLLTDWLRALTYFTNRSSVSFIFILRRLRAAAEHNFLLRFYSIFWLKFGEYKLDRSNTMW